MINFHSKIPWFLLSEVHIFFAVGLFAAYLPSTVLAQGVTPVLPRRISPSVPNPILPRPPQQSVPIPQPIPQPPLDLPPASIPNPEERPELPGSITVNGFEFEGNTR